MAAIYLIRHGQASFGKADYDQLSEHGMKQAQILGKYWQSLAKPDKFYSGDLLRHGQSLEHFLEGYQKNEAPVIIHSGFNEFDHVDILKRYKPQWGDFTQKSSSMPEQQETNKVIQKEFFQAMNRWILSNKSGEYKESWQQFKTRCIGALQKIIMQALSDKKTVLASGESKNILIFTSGGPISVIIQHILQLSDKKMLVMNQQLRNTSVTKLLFSENVLSIDYINNYSHLELAGAEWPTFR